MLLNRFFQMVLMLLFSLPLHSQQQGDTAACLLRYKKQGNRFVKIPMTSFCFVRDAALTKEYESGWIMKWDVVPRPGSNLLFMEMNSTDVEGWMTNDDVSGSVQLVFKVPSFTDSILLANLSYKTKGVYTINNYGGLAKKEHLNGSLKIISDNASVRVSSAINLYTERPNTMQQFLLSNNPVQSYTFDQYQAYANMRDSLREAEHDAFSNALTEVIMARDSIWEIEGSRIKDSLKLHPYTGPFRFWISDVDKAGYSRVTYAIDEDSLVIKKGPYDFIYLAKNYSRDSVYFRRALTRKEKELLAGIEQIVNTDSLDTIYHNFCIMDGLIYSFAFESAAFTKGVTVSNFYNERIAAVVEFINKIAPKKYRLWYNKEKLLEMQCKD